MSVMPLHGDDISIKRMTVTPTASTYQPGGLGTGMSTSARDSLNAFIEDVGAPERIKTDSAAEFTGRNSEFAKLCRKRSIRQTFQEAGRSNQIPHVDVQIRELRK
eukprot:scaffold2548_cov135-Alexandrium_tamarense.AAC.1